nr:MAG TPA: hypothetical protein [Caudoviricetes sp.]
MTPPTPGSLGSSVPGWHTSTANTAETRTISGTDFRAPC